MSGRGSGDPRYYTRVVCPISSGDQQPDSRDSEDGGDSLLTPDDIDHF